MARKVAVRNASDPQQVKRAKESERRREERRHLGFQAMLESQDGRAVLWWLIEQSRSFQSTFDQNPVQMAYNSGRQDAGHFLMAEIMDADQEAWMLMQIEANNIEASKSEPENANDDSLD